MTMTTSSADPVVATLAVPPPHQSIVVAFSGGLDSTVLLHALVARGVDGLCAVHVHHGLQDAADDWAAHCGLVAARLGVPLTVIRVAIDPRDPSGPEGAARAARYAALREGLGTEDLLVTAHHRDDQAETVLLRLLRGSGVRGLAAMAPLSPLPPARHWRPLLDLPRAALAAYAVRHGLDWIDDPHNADPRYTRSWLRNTVMPQLRERFPQADARLVAAAAHAAEAEHLLDELAALDLGHCRCAAAADGDDGDDVILSITALEGLSAARRRNLLRHWLRRRVLPVPDAAMLDRVEHEMLGAAPDAEPLLAWSGAELRRYRDQLFAMAPLPAAPSADWSGVWRAGSSFGLPSGCGTLHANSAPPAAVTIRLAAPGERWRVTAGSRSSSLKNRFQEAGVPPWRRLRTVVLSAEDGSRWIPELKLRATTAAFAHWWPEIH